MKYKVSVKFIYDTSVKYKVHVKSKVSVKFIYDISVKYKVPVPEQITCLSASVSA